jgi:hypothetical protein
MAIENKEAETVAKAICFEWFCKFGIPAQIHTDGGKSLLTNYLKNYLIFLILSTLKQLRPILSATRRLKFSTKQ